jgi:hypothetical protein
MGASSQVILRRILNTPEWVRDNAQVRAVLLHRDLTTCTSSFMPKCRQRNKQTSAPRVRRHRSSKEKDARESLVGDAQVVFAPVAVSSFEGAPWLSLGCWTAGIAATLDTARMILQQLLDVNGTEV